MMAAALVGHHDLVEGIGDDDSVAQGVKHRLDLATLGLRHAVADLQIAQLVLQSLLALTE